METTPHIETGSTGRKLRSRAEIQSAFSHRQGGVRFFDAGVKSLGIKVEHDLPMVSTPVHLGFSQFGLGQIC